MREVWRPGGLTGAGGDHALHDLGGEGGVEGVLGCVRHAGVFREELVWLKVLPKGLGDGWGRAGDEEEVCRGRAGD